MASKQRHCITTLEEPLIQGQLQQNVFKALAWEDTQPFIFQTHRGALAIFTVGGKPASLWLNEKHVLMGWGGGGCMEGWYNQHFSISVSKSSVFLSVPDIIKLH